MAIPTSSDHPRLGSNDIHVWRLPLQGTTVEASQWARLPTDERTRAERFHFAIHRNQYLRAHLLLRRLLAMYLGEADCLEPFQLGPEGKPSLTAAAPVRFNLAHSGEVALAAFAVGTEVGIDVERVADGFPVEEVAEHFFSAPERLALNSLPENRRRAGFFHVWSQKEAYLKGRGYGVSRGLEHFDVETDPTRPAALLADRHDPAALARWKLFTVEAGEGFRAALAVEGLDREVSCFDLPTDAPLSP